MSKAGRILLIEDDSSLALALESVLRAEEYSVTVTHRGDKGLSLAEHEPFDAVLTDLRLPGTGGLEVVRRLRASRPRLPIVLMTAHGTTETAIEATKGGAYDYLLKPFEMEDLIDLVARAVDSGRRMSEVVGLGEAATARDALVGTSRVMQDLYKEIGRVAAKPVTVLIRGETGTGKELIARALYQHSDRADAPFIAVNCAAIPETLLESELFGHERGAFTGAVERRIGRFEQAAGGTLFLDEIGEMGASTQAKLLRVLQERVIQRLGGRETIPADVRVLAATHVKLEEAIAARQFREDLFYRLNQVTLSLPPLRERFEDLAGLAEHFVRKHGGALGVEAPAILPEAIGSLRGHSWPGNVRELENVIRQALLQARGYPITAEIIGQVLAKSARQTVATGEDCARMVIETLEAVQRGELLNAHATLVGRIERELFAQAIRLAGGNQARAARWLGVSRVTMREKLRHFGLKERAAGDEAHPG